MNKRDAWKTAVELVRDTGDIMVGYAFFCSFMEKIAPYKQSPSLVSFQVQLRTYAKQFGIALPDRRRKKEDNDGAANTP